MMLPEAERAVVAPEKILRYLLDPTNPRNQGKHGIFFALGYTREMWERLRDDLLMYARMHPVASVEVQEQATVYNVDGVLIGPSGCTRRIRTAWRIDRGRIAAAAHHRISCPIRETASMKEYDEVELTQDAPDWQLQAGSRGVIVDAVHGDDFVAVEFYEQEAEIAVHLVPVSMLRVTDPYPAPVAAASETAHP